MNPDMLAKWIPIGISSLAFCVSCVSLGWNIYRDIVLKARVRVRVAVSRLGTPGTKNWQTYISIDATNHGPGKVRLTGIHARNAPWWKRWRPRRGTWMFIVQDSLNPYSTKLPVALEPGESVNLLLPYEPRAFLGVPVTHIGMADSFGRMHFAPRAMLRAAKAEFAKDFPGGKPRDPDDDDP